MIPRQLVPWLVLFHDGSSWSWSWPFAVTGTGCIIPPASTLLFWKKEKKRRLHLEKLKINQLEMQNEVTIEQLTASLTSIMAFGMGIGFFERSLIIPCLSRNHQNIINYNWIQISTYVMLVYRVEWSEVTAIGDLEVQQEIWTKISVPCTSENL